MKILHIIDSFGLYGAEIMLLHLMQEQIKRGIEPILLCLQPPDDSTKNTITTEAFRRGLEVVNIYSNKRFNIKLLFDIRAAARKRKVDLIHSHGYKGDILLALIPKLLMNIPRICTVHGWISTAKFTKIWFYRQLDKLSLRRMDAVVNVNSVSPTVNGKVKIHIVENGLSEPIFRPEDIKNTYPSDYEFCKDGYIIGAISRLSEEKGLKYIIDAMHILLKENSDFKLIIIGGGPEKNNLQNRINDSGLSESVLLAGYRNEAYNYLPLFNIYALPSLSEGLPMTILEAMLASVPIVASKVGGIPKVLNNGKNGLLVDAGDVYGLARSILKLRRNNELANDIVNSAKKTVLKEYTIERMSENYLSIYNSVLKQCKS